MVEGSQRGWSQDGLRLGRFLQGHSTFGTISYISRITVTHFKHLGFLFCFVFF